ncbi:MAG: rhodanese-like domain-containing protein, partial [Desulfotignum sp.]
MRDGIKGWKQAGNPIVGEPELLEALIEVNKNDFAALLISEADAKKLKNCTFVDFRDKSKYEKGHIEGANYVDYSDMFSYPMMEELNKDKT